MKYDRILYMYKSIAEYPEPGIGIHRSLNSINTFTGIYLQVHVLFLFEFGIVLNILVYKPYIILYIVHFVTFFT